MNTQSIRAIWIPCGGQAANYTTLIKKCWHDSLSADHETATSLLTLYISEAKSMHD